MINYKDGVSMTVGETDVINPDYEKFKEKLYRKSGINLSSYKSKQMMRRINMLVQGAGAQNFCDYFNIVNKDTVLYEKLINHITINVSEFFRNREQFNVLQKEIIPLLLKNTKNNTLKFWCAGSSTGEEPYTIAMILEEYFSKCHYTILATDIDKNVLAKSQKGLYPIKNTENVSHALFQKHFTKNDVNTVQIDPQLKKHITFKHHNLLLDRFETGFDLILCRNVVIYFTEETKFELYKHFYQSLKPNGVLFTGSTEQIFRANEIGFSSIRHFFYQRKE